MEHSETEGKTSLAGAVESAAPRDPMKVLLVDDSPHFIRAAMRFLSEFDSVLAVRTAGSGAEAVQAVERDRPDLVLMDLNMPGMSGLAVVRRIKTMEPDVRVVIVSLNESDDFRAAAEAAGADGYIAKRHFATGILALFADSSPQRLAQ
jgi:two-component system, NarL family, nitrate/nitrite response regulator NarL